MDVKRLIFVTILALVLVTEGQTGVVFNFHDKLRMATATTTEDSVKTGQIIRVPDLDCPDGYRRDHLGNCRQRL
ncbi:unnamed protein product [Leptidea sinapis]|uniref:Uncharacterized protein n=1 Tax=Leptidea sinapis TaxID=189913 RepID=A0A5E4Q2Z2_9NEOP|nr:unnamed protein product [Leptidea sinapis]